MAVVNCSLLDADSLRRRRFERQRGANNLYTLLCASPQVIPPKRDHTLPPAPRVDLHKGDGGTLADFERVLRPFAAKRNRQQQQQGSIGASGSVK